MTDKLDRLLVRKQKNGGNVGALDFLIDFHRKKLGISGISESSETFSSNIDKESFILSKEQRVYKISQEISSKKMSEEFDFLLEYAAEIRKIDMSETYIGLVKYILLQYSYLSEENKKKLVLHLANVLKISRDEELVSLIFTEHFDLIVQIPLSPKQKDALFFTDFANAHDYTKNNFRFLAFDLQDSPNKAVHLILANNPDELLKKFPEMRCLVCNASVGNNEVLYKETLNIYLHSFNLPQVTCVEFYSPNILSTVGFENLEHFHNSSLVSIIMSAYNAEDTIEYAIKSLLNQTYKNIEILVCDDESEDSTCDIINKISAKDSRVKAYKSNGNQGTYNIRNEMLKNVSGDYITFQDSDDYALPNRIELQVGALEKSNKVMCVAQWVRITPQGEFVFFHDDKLSRFCVVSSMLKRDAFCRVGEFRQSLVAADTEFYEKMLSLYGEDNIVKVDKPLIFGLWGDGSLTKASNLTAENNGFVAKRRRAFSDIAARQRVLGKAIIPDCIVNDILKENSIYRANRGARKATQC